MVHRSIEIGIQKCSSSSMSIFIKDQAKTSVSSRFRIFLEWNVHAIDVRNVVDIRIGPKRKYRRISQHD